MREAGGRGGQPGSKIESARDLVLIGRAVWVVHLRNTGVRSLVGNRDRGVFVHVLLGVQFT